MTKESGPAGRTEKICDLDMSGKMEIPCISEEHYAEEMAAVVEPYLFRYIEAGYYDGLYYELFPQEEPKGTIVLNYGFTESCEKYHEMIYYFHRMGYQAAVMDYRGHGLSKREVDNKCVVHISRFSKYVEDMHGFVSAKVIPMQKGKPLYLYAHSRGGCIGALYLEQYPEIFAKAVLNAPMLGIQLGGMPLWLASGVCRFFMVLGQGKKRVFLMKEFQEEEPFEMSGTSSKVRHAFYRELQKKNTDYQTCCSTYTWVNEAIRAGRRALKPENMARVKAPVLLFQALEDAFVRPQEQEVFIAGIREGTLVRARSRHEIGRGPNEVMEPYFARVFEFLRA